MKTKIIISVVALAVMASSFCQKPTIELTFTAIDNASYVQLDSIKVMNRTHVGDSVIYWPDTTLTMETNPGDLLLCIGYSSGYPVGLEEIYPKTPEFTLFQNFPNPVKDQSIISMFIPEKGLVNVMVTDVQGKLIISSGWQLDKGNHSFRFTPGDANLFFLTARWNGVSRSIKILTSEPNSGKRCTLDYTGNGNGKLPLKASSLKMDLTMLESGILDAPQTNKTYTFQFATNIPCPGTPIVTYEGQVYSTIQIFSQCWLKENLNAGTMISGILNMLNNGIIEKYCYLNDTTNCTIYGGLYQWNEMMQYKTTQGVKGICPTGWHISTDEEWKVLEGAVDSQYGIGDPDWDFYGYRGFDAGTNLKSLSGWNDGGNGTDLFGFSSLPGGYRHKDGVFRHIAENGVWWTSTKYGIYGPEYHWLDYSSQEVGRIFYNLGGHPGFSVRCLRDN
jgi:uncharacterized protein (TIGR02145 family)